MQRLERLVQMLCKLGVTLGIFLFLGVLGVLEAFCLLFMFISRETVEHLIHIYSRCITQMLVWNMGIGNRNFLRFYNARQEELQDPFPSARQDRSYILLSNHVSAMDTVIVGYIGHSLFNIRLKYIAKRALQWVPLVGWGMRMGGYLFIEREKALDQENIKKWCSRIRDKKQQGIVLYPEGTRLTKQKHKLSVEYAVRTEQPILKHLLFPRVKGFHICADALAHSTFANIIHVTIVYTENGKKADPPGFFSSLLFPIKGNFSVMVDVEEDVELANPEEYLIHAFVQKDAAIDRFIASTPSLEGTLRRCTSES
ncbi:lysophosphatidic acid acyltransferase / lysophosphatidylinositol acyltransferase [Nematocida sp. AWRm77]|nr:lysophosphatidic acid acyltransferase / lysophosphatidylinositol acyltransferase [Nematocida sp. AWRm77]